MSDGMKAFFIFVLPGVGAISLGVAAILASSNAQIGFCVAAGIWALASALQTAIFHNTKKCG